MVIFKICRHNKRLEKKLVKATTIDELLHAAKIKLDLPEEKYKIFTEDNCEIDDNDILTELAKHSKDHLLLTIVPDGIPWNSDVSKESTSTVSTAVSDSTSQPSTSSRQKDLDKIFSKLNTKVQKALRNGKFLGYGEKKDLVHVVEQYMVNDLSNVSLGAAIRISKEIVDEYPDSFKVKIGSQHLKGTAKSLAVKIYNRIHYNKKDKAECTLPLSYDVDDLDEPSAAPKAQDEYGCIAYLPNLTSPETWESQENKRLEIIECNKSAIPLNDNIMKSMAETYCLQRKCIHKEKNLSKFFNDWPYFKCYKTIIAHANELLGKDTMEVWKGSLKELSKPINCFARNSEIVASEKYRKKHRNATLPEELTCIRKQLKEATEFSHTLKNEDPYCNIVFEFIVKFMGGKEDIKYLYLIIEEEVHDDELLEAVKVSNPVLIIRGQNLHDSSNSYDVVIEKEIIIRVNSFLDGILVTFLCYYIFGFVYPPEIEGTLETIQRLFLKIDPPKGTKRGGKRKATVQHPKLTKFMEEIDQYKNSLENDI